jgi:HEAT repeat protein
MVRFLVHPRAEVVASAIEAIVERADPAAVPKLKKLLGDTREVTVPELDDEKVTLGDLAADALSFFEEVFEDEAEEPPPPARGAAGRPKGPSDRGGRRR